MLENCITTTKSHEYPASGREKGGGVIKKDRLPKVTIRGKNFGERTLPSLNDYIAQQGIKPQVGNKFKGKYQQVCMNAIRRCLRGWKVEHPPVVLHYKFFEINKGKRRDVMNIFSFADKVFEDALTETKTMGNDNPDWVVNTTHEFFWIDPKDEPYIEIEIEERGN